MAKSTEPSADFYKYKFDIHLENLNDEFGHFNGFRIEDTIQSGRTSPILHLMGFL